MIGKGPGGSIGKWTTPVAIVRRGGTITDATTTSTTEVELQAIASLNIPVTTPLELTAAHRKTGGAATGHGCGFRLNTTNIMKETVSTTTDRAENGFIAQKTAGAATNYLAGQDSYHFTRTATVGAAKTPVHTTDAPNAMPNATTTDVSVRGNIDTSGITMGCTNFQAYSRTTS